MLCPYCGAAVQDGSPYCTNCGAVMQSTPSIDQMMNRTTGTYPVYSVSENDEWGYLPENQQAQDFVPIMVPRQLPKEHRRNKPSIVLRLPLQILSFLLSIFLFVSLIGTALLMDCNRLLSAAGIKQVMNAVFSVSTARTVMPVMPGAVGVGANMDPFPTLPPDVQIPELPNDALLEGDTDAIVDWICDVASQMVGQEVQVDRQRLQEFVEQSTLTDYVAEKAAGYAADFINGTQDTQLTTEELMGLLEENETLIEETFQVHFTREMKQELEQAITTTIEDNRLNEVIHEQVFTSMEQALSASLPVEWSALQNALQMLTSDTVMMGALGICLALVLLLCLLNFYNVPGGLTWSAVPCILAGGILSLPVAFLQASPALITETIGMPGSIMQLILSFLQVFATVHYGLLAFGVVLLVLSIIWRILRASVRSGA